MIINQINKNDILKGTVKRGLNQDPMELRTKLHPIKIKPDEKKLPVNNNPRKLSETYVAFKRLKWK